VIAAIGDMGMMCNLGELETACASASGGVRRVQRPGLGNERAFQNELYGGRTFAVDYGDVDFAALARVLGCFGERVTDPAEVLPAIKRAAGERPPGGRRRPDRQGQPRRGGAQGLGGRGGGRDHLPEMGVHARGIGLDPVKCSKASTAAYGHPAAVQRAATQSARSAQSRSPAARTRSQRPTSRFAAVTGRTEDPGARHAGRRGVDHAVGPPEDGRDLVGGDELAPGKSLRHPVSERLGARLVAVNDEQPLGARGEDGVGRRRSGPAAPTRTIV